MRTEMIDVSKMSAALRADLMRLGLMQPVKKNAAPDTCEAHIDLCLFLPLLSDHDIRLVPMVRDGCPVQFCTGTLKINIAGDWRAGRNANVIPAGGQADTLRSAAFGCLGELAERLSLCRAGEDDQRIVVRQELLPEVEIANLLGLSETQSRRAARRLADGGKKLDAKTPDWGCVSESHVVLRRLQGEEVVQCPSFGILFRDLDLGKGQEFGFASTVGCAVWHSHEGARRRALLELVERDAVGQAWYNRLGITHIPREFVDPVLGEVLCGFLDGEDREWRLFSVDTDFEVHVVIAISYEPDGKMCAFGSAAGLNMPAACNAAVEEMLQSENALVLMDRAYPVDTGATTSATNIPRQLAYARQKSILDDLPIRTAATSHPARHDACFTHEDLLRSCMDQNIEIWEFDATRADLNIPCVKLISKDLCSWEPRFGKKRLYDGVVRRGLRRAPGTEDEFQKRPFPF
ncbi:YcaO-like family protein [Roseibium sp. HPY-6]|uniref:YcaO-like family protein n=1 Tax=Roseibium sp. HPY-6 TaxID=3229852 RepID=UPI00338D7E76